MKLNKLLTILICSVSSMMVCPTSSVKVDFTTCDDGNISEALNRAHIVFVTSDKRESNNRKMRASADSSSTIDAVPISEVYSSDDLGEPQLIAEIYGTEYSAELDEEQKQKIYDDLVKSGMTSRIDDDSTSSTSDLKWVNLIDKKYYYDLVREDGVDCGDYSELLTINYLQTNNYIYYTIHSKGYVTPDPSRDFVTEYLEFDLDPTSDSDAELYSYSPETKNPEATVTYGFNIGPALNIEYGSNLGASLSDISKFSASYSSLVESPEIRITGNYSKELGGIQFYYKWCNSQYLHTEFYNYARYESSQEVMFVLRYPKSSSSSGISYSRDIRILEDKTGPFNHSETMTYNMSVDLDL